MSQVVNRDRIQVGRRCRGTRHSTRLLLLRLAATFPSSLITSSLIGSRQISHRLVGIEFHTVLKKRSRVASGWCFRALCCVCATWTLARHLAARSHILAILAALAHRLQTFKPRLLDLCEVFTCMILRHVAVELQLPGCVHHGQVFHPERWRAGELGLQGGRGHTLYVAGRGEKGDVLGTRQRKLRTQALGILHSQAGPSAAGTTLKNK